MKIYPTRHTENKQLLTSFKSNIRLRVCMHDALRVQFKPRAAPMGPQSRSPLLVSPPAILQAKVALALLQTPSSHSISTSQLEILSINPNFYSLPLCDNDHNAIRRRYPLFTSSLLRFRKSVTTAIILLTVSLAHSTQLCSMGPASGFDCSNLLAPAVKLLIHRHTLLLETDPKYASRLNSQAA